MQGFVKLIKVMLEDSLKYMRSHWQKKNNNLVYEIIEEEATENNDEVISTSQGRILTSKD